MKAFKVKVKKTKGGELQAFEGQSKTGSVRVQSIFYSNTNPAQHLILYDKDGDCFLFPVPGQIEKKVIPLDAPLTVSLPIYYLDEGEENEVIVFGEQE